MPALSVVAPIRRELSVGFACHSPSAGRKGRDFSAIAAYMTELGDIFARLGLEQYLETFVTEGFETWETVLDITESDL